MTSIAAVESNRVNRKLGFFFAKLIGLIVAWELLYQLLLKPGRILDGPLTNLVTAISVAIINLFYSANNLVTYVVGVEQGSDVLFLNGKAVFIIADQCNALDLMVIYLGMLFLLPSRLKRKLAFMVLGILVILLANILRCVALYWLYMNHRAYFDFNHHYTFTILLYLLIFGGWLLFTKNITRNASGG